MIPIVGQTYAIRLYKHKPSYWDPNGHMMKYTGRLVTVSLIEDTDREWCKIKEDNGRWSWRFEDLELVNIDFEIEDLFEI